MYFNHTPRKPKVAFREPGLEVHLRFAFEPGEQHGAALSNPLFELLAAVLQSGSISQAARTMGTSYRYVWGSLRKWEQTLGEPLVIWSQGQRARPTQFAQRLLWAERRARTRMQPHIEALRTDLARVLLDARDERHQVLSIRASHDTALPILQRHVADAVDLHLEIGFLGSVDALRALNDRRCIIAGFHVPVDAVAAPVFLKALKPLLKPGLHTLIGCAKRMQGLIMRPDLARQIVGFEDLARHRLRFVNRHVGSGTRLLIQHLMKAHAVTATDLPGFDEHVENTHVAVALCIASGVADVGIGVEAAAVEFGLHFVPIVEENYFLACLLENVAQPSVQRLRGVLSDTPWRDILAKLPGYHPAAAAGELLAPDQALPWWSTANKRRARAQ